MSSFKTHRSIDIRRLRRDKTFQIDFTASAEDCEEIKGRLDLVSLKKVVLRGEIKPLGKTDWQLDAQLGATAQQSCVVTLDPVTTRVDASVLRHYVANLDIPDGATEVEMPEDDTQEEIPQLLDFIELISESLAIELPDFPKAEGIEFTPVQVAQPGVDPMTDEDTKPFASLAALKTQLEGDKDGK